MSYPKHKPSLLDDRGRWGRELLYTPNFDASWKRKNWEGIEAAQKRWTRSQTPEDIAAKILHRLYERLRVANGNTRHIDQETGEQVRVDRKTTKNLIGNLVRVSRQIKSTALREDISAQVVEIREKFRTQA